MSRGPIAHRSVFRFARGLCSRNPVLRIPPRLLLVPLLALLAACAGEVVQKPYTEQELQERCERHGGWWRPDALMGGYCEYQAPGFV